MAMREGSTGNGYLFGLQVYERAGISLVEVYERVEKSAISVCKEAKGAFNSSILWL